ncbi:hypothetical protein [Bacillus safensis]|uniref:hypothetical protein n=1 Tax=Bacillus safensis TaxID=561879 RepID=UPI001E570C9C|nr:hypothetical protein [Bacillus safensis]
MLWIGEPFRYDYKMIIKVYFRSQGRTEGILMDWGTLPCLATQHFYTDGILTASKAPKSVEEIDMTIYPNIYLVAGKDFEVRMEFYTANYNNSSCKGEQ